MSVHIPSGLREFDKWLSASIAEAEAVVPALLALPGPLLLRELRMRPALRTHGVLRRLLTVARDSVDRFPSRAHEITLIVARYARSMQVPPDFAFVLRALEGEAWRDHASVLRQLDRPDRAMRAIRRARQCLMETLGSSLQLAAVDLIEAPLLHDRGRHEEALQMVRRAAHGFAMSGDHARFVEARMIESWMLWSAGDPARAITLWQTTADEAQRRGNVAIMARLAAKMGLFELRYGRSEEASRLLAAALALFDVTPNPEEGVRTRWHLAEAAAAGGRIHEAISEYHIVRAQLLEQGALLDAALAAMDVLDLYLLAGREEQMPALIATLAETFRDAHLPINAMEPIVYLRNRAAAGTLRRADILLARSFFEELPQNPTARFRAF
jgi:tetratricopeptide (TPR) repeat protein